MYVCTCKMPITVVLLFVMIYVIVLYNFTSIEMFYIIAGDMFQTLHPIYRYYVCIIVLNCEYICICDFCVRYICLVTNKLNILAVSAYRALQQVSICIA